MKILLKSLFFLTTISCLNACTNYTLPFTPKVNTATFSYKTIDEFERGYQIVLDLDNIPNEAKLKNLIIHQKRFDYRGNVKVTNQSLNLNEYFPITSKLIVNFTPPNKDERSNGIVFELNEIMYFYPVNFNTK